MAVLSGPDGRPASVVSGTPAALRVLARLERVQRLGPPLIVVAPSSRRSGRAPREARTLRARRRAECASRQLRLSRIVREGGCARPLRRAEGGPHAPCSWSQPLRPLEAPRGARSSDARVSVGERAAVVARAQVPRARRGVPPAGGDRRAVHRRLRRASSEAGRRSGWPVSRAACQRGREPGPEARATRLPRSQDEAELVLRDLPAAVRQIRAALA